MTTMDLTRLPVTMSKMRNSDKENMRQDREEWWNKFYNKYEKLSKLSVETVGIDEIDDPTSREIEDDLGVEGFRLEPIVSKTFQKWVREHEDEIDELTTIAGPPGEDEEEIGGSDEEMKEYETEEPDCDSEDISDDHCEGGNQTDCSRILFCDSDDDSETEAAIPKSFSTLYLSPVKLKPNSSFREKFLSPKVTSSRNISLVEKFLSPKFSSSRNISLLEASVNNSSLVCRSCSLETDYSKDLGIDEEQFKCDDCLLKVHRDCNEDCRLCRDIASQVDNRRQLKEKYEEKEKSSPFELKMKKMDEGEM